MSSYKNISFNPFLNEFKTLLGNDADSSDLFYETMFENINAEYFTIENIGDKMNSFSSNACSFSILHVNIRSIKKNFSNFRLFLSQLKHEFSVICLTETWCNDQTFRNDSNLRLID